MQETKIILVGPNEGKTINLGGHQFVDGALIAQHPEDKPEAVQGLIRYLGISFNAHPQDSKALKEAQAAWAAHPSNGGKKAPAKKTTGGDHGTQGGNPGAGGDEMTVAEAVGKLDPEDDDHWTSTGLPDVKAVIAILGRSTTRSEIEKEAEGVKRPEVEEQD